MNTPKTSNTGFPVHPDDLAPGEVPDEHFYLSCQSHCCIRHGCKYGHEGCPVETKQVTQDYPCEQCTDKIDAAARYTGGKGYSKPGEVGYSITLGFKCDGAAEGDTMRDMPTDAQVATAVKNALNGLIVNGWTLTRTLGADDD